MNFPLSAGYEYIFLLVCKLLKPEIVQYVKISLVTELEHV